MTLSVHLLLLATKRIVPVLFLALFTAFMASCSSQPEKAPETEKAEVAEKELVPEVPVAGALEEKEAQAEATEPKKKVASEKWTTQNTAFNPALGTEFPEGFTPVAQSDAIEDVFISKTGTCGLDGCGKIVFLNNNNEEKAILISTSITWKDASGKNRKFRNYKVNKGAAIPVGCSSICADEDTKVKWSIIGAEYLN